MALEQFTILGICGSLRRQSMNRGLLRSAEEQMPVGIRMTIHDIGLIPLYDADVEGRGVPAPVRDLKHAILTASAILIATPEYNWSIPGVLKNALDWASRPLLETPLRQKPVAILGVSGGTSGTIRAQMALRDVLQGIGTYTLPKPDLFIFQGREKFDGDGNLTDEPTRVLVRNLVVSLVDWARR